jgi:hypothetical protein
MFKVAVNANQKVYTVFDSYDAALDFGQTIISANEEIEVVIYSGKQEVLFYSNE